MGSKQEANSPAAGSNAATSDCSATEWGLPDNIGQLQQRGLQAHAVIATVPDPVHSHLAPEFDRAMDALVGAASDNRYLRRTPVRRRLETITPAKSLGYWSSTSARPRGRRRSFSICSWWRRCPATG
jgi:hypothetical protein